MKIQAQLLLGDWASPPVVDLTDYDVILINTSAGKDSQTMLREIFQRATQAGVTDRLVAVHCDLGRIEWSGTRNLAQAQAAHYGIPFAVVRRTGGDLLDYVAKRGKWPAQQYRTLLHQRFQTWPGQNPHDHACRRFPWRPTRR